MTMTRFKNGRELNPRLLLDRPQGSSGNLLGIMPWDHEFVTGNGRIPLVVTIPVAYEITSSCPYRSIAIFGHVNA